MGLILCSTYPKLISAAIMFYNSDSCGGVGGNFEMRGWWNIEPQSCVHVYADDLHDVNRYWFYYAEAEDGATWSGPYSATVPTAKFDQCYGTGVIVENGDESETIGFRELDIDDNDNYTLTFTA
jgi:uncharacterized membrane protein